MEHFIQFSLSKLISKLPISLFISFVLLLSCTSKQEQIDRVEFKKNGANYVAEATTYQLALTDDRIEVQTTQMQSGMKLNHAKKAPAFDQASQEIVYEEAFDKANLVVYDKGTGNVGYDIRLLPRGQIEDIQIELEDGENAYVAESGELIIPLENSEIRHSRPYAYQEIDGQTIEVDSRFTLAEGILSFEVGAYNQDYTLVIDPEISFVETSESMLMPTATLPIQLGMAAATCGSRSNGQVGQNLTATGFVFGIYDIREPDCPSNAAPNAPANWDAASAGVYHDPRWIAANLSEVYGLDIEYDNLTNPDFFLGACGVTNVVATNTNPISGGTGGEIFRIDGTSGNISVLASLPNADFTEANDVGTPFQHFAGLGNVSYNADNQVVYATNLSDGNIYTVDLSNGNTLQTYDPTPGTPDNTSLNFTQQERLVWGIEYNRCNGKLYYAKIAAGQSPDATIFSAGLNANGTIDGTDIQLEFTFDPQVPNPPFFPEQFAIVSDIEFSVDCQKMLLGTRTLSPQVPGDPVVRTGFFSGQAHRSRVFRFDFSGSSWTNFTNYIIGTFTSVESGWNCGGGTAFGYSNYGDCGTDNAIDDAMVATGDALVFSGAASPNIYGLQISDIDGNQSGFPGNSYFVDLNGSIGSGTQVDKYTNFDVDVLTVIPCDLTISSITPDPVCPCGGTYEVDFALTWTDAPTTGDFQVSIDGGSTFTTVTRTNSAASGSETITLTGQSCDAAMKSVVVRFVGDDTCSDDSSYTAPAETPAPSINSIDDITVCDETSIVLPAIQGTNLTGNEAYFTQPDGGGDEFAAGATFNISGNTTLYAFDSVEPPVTGCSDEEQFDIIVQAVEINVTPALTPATCSGSTNNNDAQVTVSSIVNGIRAGISSPGNGSYDGDDFATIGSDNVSGGSITFMNLEPNQDYIIRVFSTATCFEEVTITTTAEVCKEILGAIGNYVWVDENSDGFQDAGEPGIPNVAVVLKDGSGTPLDTTYTDSDGKYLFPDLPAGDYLVDVLDGTDGTANTLPNSGLTQTTIFTNVVDGSDTDTVNDDGDLGNKDHSTGGGYAITLDEGEENLTADFGYNYNPTIEVNDPSDSGNMVAEVAAIGDRVWIDSDGDGVQDPNEVGVSGVEITLFTDSDGDGVYDDQVGTPITTDENGYYLFDDLPPGAYVTQVTDDAGASHDILDDTQYEQTGDPDHFGTSKDDNPDDSVEGDNRQTKPVVLGPGDVYLNSDYGYQPDDATPLGSIGNTIWLDADADGNGPSDSSIGVTGGSSNNGLGTDDSSEHPIEGVSVALIDDVNGDGIWDADGADNIPGTADDEKIIATDVTDEQGQYLFEDLPLDKNGSDSDYIVWVNDTENVLQDLRPTYDGDDSSLNTTAPEATGVGDDASEVLGMSDVTISSGNPDDRRQDFGYTPDEHDSGEGYIGDFVWFDTDRSGTSTPDMGEEGIEGVVLELLDVNGMVIQTTTTDEDGFYLFGNLPVDADGETYTVRVASSNFDPMGVLEGLEPTYEPDGDTDNSGDPITLFTDTGSGENGNLDQDFSYTGDDTNTLGSIGSTIWEDTDNDGIYEPFGTDNMDGTSDDETPLEGVTVNLIRDLNGNGQIDPGEPIIGTQTTDADGNYLFDQLPMGDYIVDVTDEDGILAGYFSSPVPSTDANTNTTGSGDTETADDKDAGSNGGGDQSKPDAFAVTLDDDPGTPDVVNNLNVDFGYYKEPAAVGNYVWLDNDGNGLQDDGETGLNGVEVTLDIEYPDGTMVTLVTITMNDADGNPGFYEFPNLLLDEDYNQGAGSNGADPTTVTPSGNTPKYVISVDPNQMILTDNGYVETTTDVNTNGNDLEDADPLSGVLAIPFQGSEDTSAKDPETNENPIASYDFGVRPPIYDLATTITISDNETDTQFTVGDPVLFDFTVTNQGADPVSDITITNYLPPALTPSADGTIGITSIVVRDENGMTRSVPVTVTKSGNDYVIDFGDTESDWLQPGDEISFDVEYTVNAGDATDNINDGIINIIEISSFDDDNDDSNTPPTDIDSTPDATDDNTFGENPRDNDNDNVVDEDGKTNPTTEDEDDHDFAEITAPNVLPVELLYFKAQADKDHVELTWSTASELNNSHFELERSEDGKTFKQIARIQGKGTTLEQTDYSYKDDKVIPNTLYYYRLKQMDFDGSFEYSEIRVVEINAITEWTLYPNPIGQDNLLNVSFYADQAVAEFFVLDAQNRSILQVKQDLSNTGWNQIQIDIAVLPSGTYILMDKEGNTKRFVVTNK